VADAGVELVDPSILLKGGEQATYPAAPRLGPHHSHLGVHDYLSRGAGTSSGCVQSPLPVN
jgi:hypothetical protein